MWSERKWPQKWQTNSLFLLPDNAPAHQAVLVKDFLAEINVTLLEHPPYSSDLAPAIFSLLWTEISTEETVLLWCYWHNRECNSTDEKAFTKWLPGMFPTPLQLLAEVYSCTRGLLGRQCSLNDCTVLYSSEISDSRNILMLPHIFVIEEPLYPTKYKFHGKLACERCPNSLEIFKILYTHIYCTPY